MDASISQVSRPARIVALALIAVVVGGLAYLGVRDHIVESSTSPDQPVLMPQGDAS
jgi:hypothetical protein